MKIAILGGAFNPPHLGHELVAKQILEFTDQDEVWLTPAYRHTFQKDMAPVSDRVQMTKMLICGSAAQRIKYCNEEISNKLNGDTIDLMNILSQKYPHDDFSFIIGADNLKNFKKWGRWEKLITNYNFLIFPRACPPNRRAGNDLDLKKYGLDKPQYKFKIIKHPLLVYNNISSSNIRERLRQGLPVEHLVPPPVIKYIKDHKLYV